MRYFISALVLMSLVLEAGAANNGRPAVSSKMVMAAPRYTASVNQLQGTAVVTNVAEPVVEQKDMREAERNACINNNIGIGNTFVWASRFSNTSNYASMVEDVEHPENNVCFVRVELKSDDESRVKVSDIGPKYFMWGDAIECGSWADAKEMEKRILDTRKGARIGGIVASTIGGAGLGVGAMELFGNEAIGHGLQGQKELKGDALYRSQFLALKHSKKTADNQKYEEYKRYLTVIKNAKAQGQISETDYEKYKVLIEAMEED